MALASAPTPGRSLAQNERRHLGALEKRIAAGLQTFRDVGSALLEIRDSRLYRETHATFEAYCSDRWGMARLRAYQLMDSAKVVKVLGDPKELANEAQARELAPLTDQPEKAKEVWDATVQLAKTQDRPVTAGLIREVKAHVLEPSSARSVADSPTERLMQDIARLAHTYERWQGSKPNVGERRKVKAAMQRLCELAT